MNEAAVEPQFVTVTVALTVPPEIAFEVFTREIDLWWLRGPRFRPSGRFPGQLQFETRLGGRPFESIGDGAAARIQEVGRVTAWEPPTRLILEWRNVNFGPADRTEVEVRFEPTEHGSRVVLVHRGWETLPPEHPARHGLEPAPFIRMLGLFWGDLLTALRLRTEARPPR